MRTIQMTLDDNLVKAVDRVSKELHTNRSMLRLSSALLPHIVTWF